MPRRDIIFHTTKNGHILQPTLCMGHDQGGGWEGRGDKLAYLRIRFGPKTTRTKKLYTSKITE